jgi:hypothetical protein
MTEISKVNLRSGSAVVSQRSEAFQAPYSIRTVLDEFTLPPVVLRNGKVKEIPALSGKEKFVLPPPINETEGYYTLHSEMATLPKTLGKGIRDMDFIVAYPPELVHGTLVLKCYIPVERFWISFFLSNSDAGYLKFRKNKVEKRRSRRMDGRVEGGTLGCLSIPCAG